MRVTYGQSVHGEKEISSVLKVLKTSTQMGKNVDLLEKKIAKLFNKKYGIMLNSASSALLIVFEALNFKDNSEVITPALNFGTAISSIDKANLFPRLVDVNAETFCVDESLIEKKINNKTVALCIPNLVGNIPHWKKIKEIAKKHNLITIEDSADTLGATIKGSNTGKYSDISITSFYGSHIINGAGNGGMLCLNDKKLYEKCLLLRSWGRSSSLFKENSEKIENRFNIKLDGIDYDKKFIFEEMGYNLEPSEISAAFALTQLNGLAGNIKKRSRNFIYNYNFFSKYPDLFIMPKTLTDVITPWLAFPIIIKNSAPFSRKDFQIYLEKNNIQTRVVFTGNILRQPCFKKYKKFYAGEKFIESDLVMKGGVLLGCHQGLTTRHLDYLHKKVENFIKLNA